MWVIVNKSTDKVLTTPQGDKITYVDREKALDGKVLAQGFTGKFHSVQPASFAPAGREIACWHLV